MIFSIFTVNGADKRVYAKEKKSKWTATTKEKTYDYTGKNIKPKVVVKYQGKKLSQANYKVRYPKNAVKPGKYKIKVTLTGKYKGKKLKGTKYIEFKIELPVVENLRAYYSNEEYLYFYWDNVYDMKMNGNNIELIISEDGEEKTIKKTIKPIYEGYDIYDYSFGVTYTFRIQSYKKIGNKKYYSKWTEVSTTTPIPDYNMTTKKVNGIDVAYNKSYYSFFQQKLEEDKQKKNISQTYFPVFIKQKLNDDFVVHTEYNGSCGYSNFTKKQYLPNRKNAEVVTDISVYYYESKPHNYGEYKIEEALYKQGYVGYILVNVSCLRDSKQPAYNFRGEIGYKQMLKDVAACGSRMTDYEKYSALKYWISCHSYSEYTCWGAWSVGEAMTELGYTSIPLFCSYDGKDGIYNDYGRYYSLESKEEHAAIGHMITLIFMKPGKYLYCEVQGYSNSDKPFKFNPKGWVKPTNSLNEALGSASNQFGLNEYDTIEELMMGDFDDVICETAKYFTKIAKELFNIELPYSQVQFFNLQKTFNLNDMQYNELMKEGHRPENLLAYEETQGASYIINKWVDEGHEVLVITGRPYDSYEPSRQWLDNHGLERIPLFCVDKYGREQFNQGCTYSMTLEQLYSMEFDLAVEDSPAAFEHVMHLNNCKVAVYNRPWNIEAKLPNDGFVRCDNWQEIDKLAERIM